MFYKVREILVPVLFRFGTEIRYICYRTQAAEGILTHRSWIFAIDSVLFGREEEAKAKFSIHREFGPPTRHGLSHRRHSIHSCQSPMVLETSLWLLIYVCDCLAGLIVCLSVSRVR